MLKFIEWEKYSDLGGNWDSGFFFFLTFIFYFWIVLLTWMMGYMENWTWLDVGICAILLFEMVATFNDNYWEHPTFDFEDP